MFLFQSSEVESDDLTIHCATCSQPVTLKKAMVHLEKCFSKVGHIPTPGINRDLSHSHMMLSQYHTCMKSYHKGRS